MEASFSHHPGLKTCQPQSIFSKRAANEHYKLSQTSRAIQKGSLYCSRRFQSQAWRLAASRRCLIRTQFTRLWRLSRQFHSRLSRRVRPCAKKFATHWATTLRGSPLMNHLCHLAVFSKIISRKRAWPIWPSPDRQSSRTMARSKLPRCTLGQNKILSLAGQSRKCRSLLSSNLRL